MGNAKSRTRPIAPPPVVERVYDEDDIPGMMHNNIKYWGLKTQTYTTDTNVLIPLRHIFHHSGYYDEKPGNLDEEVSYVRLPSEYRTPSGYSSYTESDKIMGIYIIYISASNEISIILETVTRLPGAQLRNEIVHLLRSRQFVEYFLLHTRALIDFVRQRYGKNSTPDFSILTPYSELFRLELSSLLWDEDIMMKPASKAAAED